MSEKESVSPSQKDDMSSNFNKNEERDEGE